MDKENGDGGGDKYKGSSGGGRGGNSGAPDPSSLLDAASLFGKCFVMQKNC